MYETVKIQLKKSLKSAAFFAAYVIVIVLLWQLVYGAVKNDYVFPSLASVLKETGRLFSESFFYSSFLRTFLRVLKAFAVSFVFATVFSVVARLSRGFEMVLTPIIATFRSLPTMAIMLILLIWSTPDNAPVIIAFLVLFPLLYTEFTSAISVVDHELIDMCKVFRVPLKKRIFQMYLPIALPNMIRGATSGLSFGLKLIVSAEVLANTYVSLGGMLQLSKIYLEIPRVFALTLLVVVVGFALEGMGLALSRFVERRIK